MVLELQRKTGLSIVTLENERALLCCLFYEYAQLKFLKRYPVEGWRLEWFPTDLGKKIFIALRDCKRVSEPFEDEQEEKKKKKKNKGEEKIKDPRGNSKLRHERVDLPDFYAILKKICESEKQFKDCCRYVHEDLGDSTNQFEIGEYISYLKKHSDDEVMRSDAKRTLEGEFDPDKTDSRIWMKKRLFEELEQNANGIKTDTIVDVFAAYDERINDLEVNGQEAFLTTGFEKTNKRVKKLKAGRLVILAARPGLGKTTFALNIVINNLGFISNEYKDPMAVGFISLEMTKMELLKKMICIRQGCLLSAVDEVMDGESKDTTVINQISNARKHLEKCNILIWDKGNIDIGQLVAQIKVWHAQNPNLKLVIIDYLQLVGSLEKDSDETRQQQIGVSSRTLKLLAQELNICILALAQLNRKIEDRRSSEKSPQLADLRESGDIEQDADVVMCLYEAFVQQGQQWNQEEQQRKPSKETRLAILKNRHGATGEIEFYFNKFSGKFEESKYEVED